MRFSTFVIRNVLRRRIRSTLTMTGMAIAVAAVVALVGIAASFKSALTDLYKTHRAALIVTAAKQFSPLAATMPQKLGEEVAKLDGVDGCCPGLVDYVSIENLGAQIIVQGWPSWSYMWDELEIVSGERISEKSKGTHSMMLGYKLAENAGLKVGDKLNIVETDYRVSGIYKSSVGLENNMAVLLLEDAQSISGKGKVITGLTLRTKDDSEATIQKIRQEIEGPLAHRLGIAGLIKAETPDVFVKEMSQIKMGTAMAWMTASIAIILGAIGVLNTMFMSVFERTREIGILRAIGWRPSRVMRMILLESVLISIGGAIMGALAGHGLILGLSRLPAVNGAIPGTVSPIIIVEGFAIALVVGLIGAAYPAYRGACLLPTEALRHE